MSSYTSSVTLNEVHIAVSAGRDTIDPATDKVLLFNGKTGFTMGPGSVITSDPLPFALQPRSDIAITIYFGNTAPDVTGHPGSRTNSYYFEPECATVGETWDILTWLRQS